MTGAFVTGPRILVNQFGIGRAAAMLSEELAGLNDTRRRRL